MLFSININCVQIIVAPGVIQLTLLDATSLDGIIRDLSRDPRYTSILCTRTGMDTRSGGGSSSTATQLLEKDSADQVHPSQQAKAASSSQAGDNGSDTRPSNLPAIPVLPGSIKKDWMSSQLGLLSRGHFRMLDDIIAPVGRQLTPVSVVIFLMFLLITFPFIHHLQYIIIFPIIHHFTNSQLYTHYSVII